MNVTEKASLRFGAQGFPVVYGQYRAKAVGCPERFAQEALGQLNTKNASLS
jgi:hypothetical protein